MLIQIYELQSMIIPSYIVELRQWGIRISMTGIFELKLTDNVFKFQIY